MHVYRKSPPVLLGSSIFDKIGGGIMTASRGILDLASKARGDTSDVYVPAGPTLSTTLIYGGLAAAAIYLVVKK